MAERTNLVSNTFNPVKGKLQSMEECLEQLRGALPKSREEYISADRMTHSFVKSCFLMIIQRAVDTNGIVIEANGNRTPHNSLQTFLAIWRDGAIDDETLGFFQLSLEYYQKLVNPYEDLSDGEIYDMASGLLEHAVSYIKQVNRFLTGSTVPSDALSFEWNRDAKVQVPSERPKETVPSPPSSHGVESSSQAPTDEVTEPSPQEMSEYNYKGELLNYCQKQKFSPPEYQAVQKGPPNEPCWMITVKWGQREYTTPKAILGGKKHAEQMTAKHVLEAEIEQPTEPRSDIIEEETQLEAMKAIEDPDQLAVALQTAEALEMPMPVIQTALGIANFRLSELRRGGKFSNLSNAEYIRQLVKLTMEIVRAVDHEAKHRKIEIGTGGQGSGN